MIRFKIYINKIDWHIDCFITTDNSYLKQIIDKLIDLECQESVVKRAYVILRDQVDSGFAYSNLNMRRSVMVVNKSTSMEEFVNTYNHEKNHIEMHICESMGIDPYSEIAADLSGCLAQLLYNAILSKMNYI